MEHGPAPASSTVRPRRRWRWGVVVGGALSLTALPATPAGADNPACPSYFSPAVVHILGDHVRAKVCYRAEFDNWRYQDTHADGRGALFRPQSNDLQRRLWLEDADGANNGWRSHNSEYPENRSLVPGICTMEFETGVNYGCTTSTVVS